MEKTESVYWDFTYTACLFFPSHYFITRSFCINAKSYWRVFLILFWGAWLKLQPSLISLGVCCDDTNWFLFPERASTFVKVAIKSCSLSGRAAWLLRTVGLSHPKQDYILQICITVVFTQSVSKINMKSVADLPFTVLFNQKGIFFYCCFKPHCIQFLKTRVFWSGLFDRHIQILYSIYLNHFQDNR